jgi:hypothetical protein
MSGRIEMLLLRGREFSPRASLARVAASAAALLALLVAASLAPRSIGFAQRLEFEVASVKRNTTSGAMDLVPRRSGDRVIIHNNQVEGFRPAVDGRPVPLREGFCAGILGRDGSHLIGEGATVAQLIQLLPGHMRGPVVDGTGGIEGKFDFNVRFIRENKAAPDGEPGPDLPTALQEELGLKLVRSKAPVEVLVIDHLGKPSEN